MNERELEIEALGALFNPDEFTVQDDTVFIKILMCDIYLTVSFDLPPEYPKSQPIISFQHNNTLKSNLINNLKDIASNSLVANAGYPCIYSTIEDIKSYLNCQNTNLIDNVDDNQSINDKDYINVKNNHKASSQSLVTHDEFKEWTNNFLKVLIARGDLLPESTNNKLTGRQIFEQITNEQFYEQLYAESPEISDFDYEL